MNSRVPARPCRVALSVPTYSPSPLQTVAGVATAAGAVTAGVATVAVAAAGAAATTTRSGCP